MASSGSTASVAPASMRLVIDCYEGEERECFRPGLVDALTADPRYLGLDATTRLILLEGMLAYSNYDGWLSPNATLAVPARSLATGPLALRLRRVGT